MAASDHIPQDDGSPSRSSRSATDSIDIDIGRQEANRKKTKFVVRKIPPFVTEDEIQTHLDEFIGCYDWYLFCAQPKGRNPTRRNKTNYNRFYINFQSFDAALPFIEKFQKLSFQKKKHKKDENKKLSLLEQYNLKLRYKEPQKVLVEFAPNQCLPKEIEKNDRRVNTIAKDGDYLKFVQALKDEKKSVIQIREKAEEECIRQNVILVNKQYSTNEQEAKQTDEDQKAEAKPIEIAPLAKHVAQRDRRKKLYSKKTTRASLQKSEKEKARKIERRREMRRRKRIALAKAGKYGSKQWAKKSEKGDAFEYDIKKKRERYYKMTGKSYEERRPKRGYRSRGRGRSRARDRDRARKSYRGRGSKYYEDEEAHFSGYSRRKGHQTWQKAK